METEKKEPMNLKTDQWILSNLLRDEGKKFGKQLNRSLRDLLNNIFRCYLRRRGKSEEKMNRKFPNLLKSLTLLTHEVGKQLKQK